MAREWGAGAEPGARGGWAGGAEMKRRGPPWAGAWGLARLPQGTGRQASGPWVGPGTMEENHAGPSALASKVSVGAWSRVHGITPFRKIPSGPCGLQVGTSHDPSGACEPQPRTGPVPGDETPPLLPPVRSQTRGSCRPRWPGSHATQRAAEDQPETVHLCALVTGTSTLHFR